MRLIFDPEKGPVMSNLILKKHSSNPRFVANSGGPKGRSGFQKGLGRRVRPQPIAVNNGTYPAHLGRIAILFKFIDL